MFTNGNRGTQGTFLRGYRFFSGRNQTSYLFLTGQSRRINAIRRGSARARGGRRDRLPAREEGGVKNREPAPKTASLRNVP